MSKRFVAIVLVLGLGCSLVLVAGCPEPPRGMVPVEGGYAWDDDHDGQPDKNADGSLKLVPGSQLRKPADTIDSVMPTVLTIGGSLLGVPVLVGIGRAWGKWKFGNVLVNTVMTVQAARKKLQDNQETKALEILTTELNRQLPQTKKMIADIKLAKNIPSVTDQ